jgi:P27 family predicted phage terminase small subunit
MPAGRPPKPIQLHRIEGTFRPDRHDSRVEPEAPGSLNGVRPPSWMSRRHRQLWREILADAPHALLRRIDRQLLVNYVELVERHERAAKAQSKIDATATTPLLSRNGGVVTVSPYVRIMNHCVLLMTKLQSEMGFTPSARASLGVPMLPTPQEPTSPHQRFDTILPDGTRLPYGK